MKPDFEGTLLDRRRALLGSALLLCNDAIAQSPPPDSNCCPGPCCPTGLVVSYAAGGLADQVARTIAPYLQGAANGTFYVENKPGAAGLIGASAVAQGKKDGSVALLATSGLAIYLRILKNPPIRLDRDFSLASFIGAVPLVLVTPASSEIRSLDDIRRATQSKKLTYGSSGSGTSSHLASVRLLEQLRIDATHVPYRGFAPLLNDVAAESMDFAFVSLPAARDGIGQGRLKAIAVGSLERAPSLSAVRTIAEQGLRELELVDWYGILLPRGVPDQVQRRWQTIAAQALSVGALRRDLAALGVTTRSIDSSQFATFMDQQTARWGEAAARAGVVGD